MASLALFRVWVPQVIAVLCGVVVVHRKRHDEQPSVVTALAGSGFLIGVLALVLAIVYTAAPPSFWTDGDQ